MTFDKNQKVRLPDGREGEVVHSTKLYTEVRLDTGHWIGCTKDVRCCPEA